MILTLILLLMLFMTIMVLGGILTIGGGVFTILFADIIVAIFIMYWLFFGRKKKK